MVKLAFPLGYKADTWRAEVPYGTIERKANGDEEPVQQWVDYSLKNAGFALANNGKYSCSVRNGEIRMAILRCTPYANHGPFKTKNMGLHEIIDAGTSRFTFAFVPHGGDFHTARVMEIARRINCPPSMLAEGPHQGVLGPVFSSAECRGRGVYIGALKESEDASGLVLRAAEWFGARSTVTFTLPWLSRRFSARFAPHQVKTFFIPYKTGGRVRVVNMLEDI